MVDGSTHRCFAQTAASPKRRTSLVRSHSFADQQYGGTFGGKIKTDKLWYFGGYEGEHQPSTYTASPIIGSAFSHPSTLKVNEWLGRLDYQRNEKNHFLLRGDKFSNSTDFAGAAEPSSAPGAACPVALCVSTYAPLSKIHYDARYGYWILERDGFRGTPYNRVDSRLQESFKNKERYNVIVAVEAFNLINHSNYGNFATTASIGTGANTYGTPLAVTGNPVEHFARSLQFIGRFSF